MPREIKKAFQRDSRNGIPDELLSDVSVAQFQDSSEFVSGRVFPVVPVLKQSGRYTFYPNGYYNRIYDSKKAREAQANTVGAKVINKGYDADKKALRTFISDDDRANAPSQFSLDSDGAQLVTGSLLLSKDVDFANNFMVTGVWTNDVDISAGTLWDDAAGLPITDVNTAKLKYLISSGGIVPNVGVMTYDVWLKLMTNPQIEDRILPGGTSVNPSIVMRQAVAELFELDEILVMKTVQNTAPDGVEDSTTGLPPTSNVLVAEKKFLLVHRPSTVSLKSRAAGMTFAWNAVANSGVDAGPSIVRYDGAEGKEGEYIESRLAIDQQITAPDLGSLLHSVIA